MKRLTLILLALLLALSTGCQVGHGPTGDREPGHPPGTSGKDCHLCGDGMDNQPLSYWGQKNVALISLNTFEIRPIGINRYDITDGRPIEGYAGVVSFGGGSVDGGFFANLLLVYDRGYATGSLEFRQDEVLDIDKAASFLCDDCLGKTMESGNGPCSGVGVINLETKEIRVLTEHTGGFGLGDFYIRALAKIR